MSIDLTPGFNLHGYAGGGIPFISKGNGTSGKSTGTGTDVGDQALAKAKNTPAKVADNTTSTGDTPANLGSSVGSTGNGATAADIAYLDSQAGNLRDLLARSQGTLDQGLTGLGDSYNKSVSDADLQRSRALQDYDTQDQQTNTAKDTALNSVNTNARTLADSLRRTLGLAGGSDSSAYQLAAPQAVARQASTQRNGVLNDYSSNEQAIGIAKTRASEDFDTLLSNLAGQRNQKESALRSGVLQNDQDINKQLADVAAQRASATGVGYAGTLAAQQPYSTAISNSQNSIDSLFNQFRTPTFDITPVNTDAAATKDYTVNSGDIGTDQSQTQDPNSTLSYYLKKQQDQTA